MSMLDKMLNLGRNSHYDNGIRLFDQGEYEKAIAEFEIACSAEQSKKDEMTERLAMFYTGESHTQLGHEAMRHGLWDRAARFFTKALDIHPNYADLHFNLALANRAGKHLKEALASLSESLAINPRFAKAYFYQGLIQYEVGDHDLGLNALKDALKLEPAFSTSAFDRGMQYHESKDFLAALQAFEQVSHTDVDDILFHFQLGDDMLRRGLYDAAIAEYQKALILNPSYADIRNNLGLAYSARKQHNEAIAQFEYALKLNPRFIAAQTNLAISLRDSGRKEEAQVEFQRALEIDPQNPVALAQLGFDESTTSLRPSWKYAEEEPPKSKAA